MIVGNLFEGFRFGGREIELVKKYAKRVTVGVEYEYKVHEGFVDVGDYVDDMPEDYSNEDDAYKHSMGNPFVNFVEEVLQDYNEWGVDIDDIERIEDDIDNVEVVTYPLDLPDALHLMKGMFDHIKDVGFTDESCGLHINMSFQNVDLNRINPLKLYILLNDDYMTGGMKRVDRKGRQLGNRAWEEREFVERVVSDKKFIHTLFNAAAYRSFDDIERVVSSAVTEEKHQGFSFGQAFLPKDSNQQRVEFRYIGGDNYERKYDDIERDIYRYAYMLYAATNPKFGRKEYQRDLMKLLDKKSLKYFGIRFVELQRIVRQNPDISIPDVAMLLDVKDLQKVRPHSYV